MMICMLSRVDCIALFSNSKVLVRSSYWLILEVMEQLSPKAEVFEMLVVGLELLNLQMVGMTG